MRLFIAIELSSKVSGILTNFQKEFHECIKASYPKSFHITLKFLGDVDEKQLKKIKDALNTISHDSILLQFDKMGIFPESGEPKIIWAGFSEEIDSIKSLQKKIEDILLDLFPKENREFKSHVTLSRIKEIIDKTEFAKKLSLPMPAYRFNIRKFILFQSTLTSDGPVYENLAEFNLNEKD